MPSLQSRFGGAVVEVSVVGGNIALETIGEGPPIILLHGWTLDRRVWAPQVPALARHYSVIAVDRRGSGQSTAPPELEREPDDLREVVETLQLVRPAVVGMSQGGRVALAFALRNPRHVSGLVLQGVPLSDVAGRDDEKIPYERMRSLASAGRLEDMRELWLGHPLMQVRRAKWRGLLALITSEYEGRDLVHTPGRLDVTTAQLPSLACPVLTITGQREPEWRQRVGDIVATHTKGKRLNFPQAGHLCNLCRAAEYNTAVIRFLAPALSPTKPPSRACKVEQPKQSLPDREIVATKTKGPSE